MSPNLEQLWAWIGQNLWTRKETAGWVNAHFFRKGELLFGPSDGFYTSKGTYTPTVTPATPGTSAFTYNSQYGEYVQVGKVVHYWAHLDIATTTLGTGSGDARISLPLAAKNSNMLGSAMLESISYGADRNLHFQPVSGQSYGIIRISISAFNANTLNSNILGNDQDIYISGTYLIA